MSTDERREARLRRAEDALKYAAAVLRERSSWTLESVADCEDGDHEVAVEATRDVVHMVCGLAAQFGDPHRGTPTVGASHHTPRFSTDSSPNTCGTPMPPRRSRGAGAVSCRATPASRRLAATKCRPIRQPRTSTFGS